MVFYDLLGISRCVSGYRAVCLCSLFHKIQPGKSQDRNWVQPLGGAEIAEMWTWIKFWMLPAGTLEDFQNVRENAPLKCVKCLGRKLSTEFQKTTQNFHQLPPVGAVTVAASLPWFRDDLLLAELQCCCGWKQRVKGNSLWSQDVLHVRTLKHTSNLEQNWWELVLLLLAHGLRIQLCPAAASPVTLAAWFSSYLIQWKTAGRRWAALLRCPVEICGDVPKQNKGSSLRLGFAGAGTLFVCVVQCWRQLSTLQK